jgi:hypothetical protein
MFFIKTDGIPNLSGKSMKVLRSIIQHILWMKSVLKYGKISS